MLKNRGFSAWIMSNGSVLPEYLVAVNEEERRVSCWIPGIEGQTFQVYWQDHNSKVDSCGFISLDGLVVPGRFLFGDGIASRGGIRSSPNCERPFVFQKVPDETTKQPYKGSGKEAGMIILKIKRIIRTDSRPANHIQNVPTVLGKRKVGDLCIGFGPEMKSFQQHNVTWDFEPYDETKPGSDKAATYVSFVFRYRSPEFLTNQGISMEEYKPPKRQPVRRITSLPPNMRDDSDTSPEVEFPAEPLPKRPRLQSEQPPEALSPLQFPPVGNRRPSAELRRTVSWTGTSTSNTNRLGIYLGESQFFLPRSVSHHQPITSIRNSSESSDSPDTTSSNDGPK